MIARDRNTQCPPLTERETMARGRAIFLISVSAPVHELSDWGDQYQFKITRHVCPKDLQSNQEAMILKNDDDRFTVKSHRGVYEILKYMTCTRLDL